MKWIKVERGFYRLDGTRYAVQSDGYPKSQSIGATAGYEGYIGGEWALIRYDNPDDWSTRDGDNLNWYGTMREAREAAERLAR